jgi:hypothetical protein
MPKQNQAHPNQIWHKQRRLEELLKQIKLYKGEVRRVQREIYNLQPGGCKAWLFRFKDRYLG